MWVTSRLKNFGATCPSYFYWMKKCMLQGTGRRTPSKLKEMNVISVIILSLVWGNFSLFWCKKRGDAKNDVISRKGCDDVRWLMRGCRFIVHNTLPRSPFGKITKLVFGEPLQSWLLESGNSTKKCTFHWEIWWRCHVRAEMSWTYITSPAFYNVLCALTWITGALRVNILYLYRWVGISLKTWSYTWDFSFKIAPCNNQ